MPKTNETTEPEVYTPAPPVMPRQRRMERQGQGAMPYSERFPKVIGGLCEFCGVLNKDVPSEQQYKLCPHYQGMQLHCTYCPDTKDPDQVIGHSSMNVASHPDNPDIIIAWCDSYECSRKHIERFDRSM